MNQSLRALAAAGLGLLLSGACSSNHVLPGHLDTVDLDAGTPARRDAGGTVHLEPTPPAPDAAVPERGDAGVTSRADAAVSAAVDAAVNVVVDAAVSDPVDASEVLLEDAGEVLPEDAGEVLPEDAGEVLPEDAGMVNALDSGPALPADAGEPAAPDAGIHFDEYSLGLHATSWIHSVVDPSSGTAHRAWSMDLVLDPEDAKPMRLEQVDAPLSANLMDKVNVVDALTQDQVFLLSDQELQVGKLQHGSTAVSLEVMPDGCWLVNGTAVCGVTDAAATLLGLPGMETATTRALAGQYVVMGMGQWDTRGASVMTNNLQALLFEALRLRLGLVTLDP